MEYFKTAKGFALVYGEPGSGKTTSIRAFTAKLNPQLFKVVYLPLSSVTVMDFYRHLAVGLGLEPRFRKVDIFHQVQEYIANAHHQKNMTTFVIKWARPCLENYGLWSAIRWTLARSFP